MNTSIATGYVSVKRWWERLSRTGVVPIIIYVALALAILGPTLLTGYILSLDMVFGPVTPSYHELFYGFRAPELGTRIVPQAMIALAGSVVPMWVVQKVILVAIFTVSGLGAHRLIRSSSEAPRYYAGILYTVNPFVYVRILAGQWYLLIAYAVAPFAIASFLAFLDRPNRRTLFTTLLLASVVAISSHVLALTLFVYALIYLSRLPGLKDRLKLHIYLAALSVAFIVINLHWVVPVATADSAVFRELTSRDLQAFAPTTVIVSPLVSVATMHGFWREGYNYAVTSAPLVIAAFGVILWLAIYGFSSTHRSRLSIVMAVAAITGVILGSGVSGPFEPLSSFMGDNVPLFTAFRDSHKFVFLLVLAYVFLGAQAVKVLLATGMQRGGLLKYLGIGAVGLAILAPVTYSFTMFWGFNGDLRRVSYPQGWEQARKIVDDDGPDVGVLVLPWETYMKYGWVPNRDTTVRTLARAFFEQPLVHPKAVIRRGSIINQSNSPEQRFVKKLIDEGYESDTFGSQIGALGVKYVMLAKGGTDTTYYRFLNNQKDLILRYTSPTIDLYENIAPAQRAFATDRSDGTGDLRPVEVQRLSTVKYKIEAAGQPYVTFVPPDTNAAAWKFEGDPPVSTEGGYRGVYFVDGGGGTFVYKNFSPNLPWYAVSMAALLVAAIAAFAPLSTLDTLRRTVMRR